MSQLVVDKVSGGSHILHTVTFVLVTTSCCRKTSSSPEVDNGGRGFIESVAYDPPRIPFASDPGLITSVPRTSFANGDNREGTIRTSGDTFICQCLEWRKSNCMIDDHM